MARKMTGAGRKPRLVSIKGGNDAPAAHLSNVSDETRRDYLERGRMALVLSEQKRQEWKSAHGIYRQVLKEAKKNGCTQIAWTLGMLKREPEDIAAEMMEQSRMIAIAKIPVGTQLGMFEPLEAQVPTVAEVIKETWEKQDSAPPKPGRDEEEEDPEEDERERQDEDEEDEGQDTKAGNEVLERNDDDANAYLQGGRAFLLGRTLEGCPYSSVTSMHGAWIRGWKAKEVAAKVSA